MNYYAGGIRAAGLALLAMLLGGCADTSTLQNDDELVKRREAILNEEYIGNEIPLVDLKNLPDVNLLVPPAAADVYTINPKVGIEGNYYIFNVHTRHGTYTVKSELALVKYCYEAGVIEMFLNCKHGKEIAAGMGEYLKESGQGAVDLLLHPVDSVKGIGRSFSDREQATKDAVVKKLDGKTDDRNRINRDTLPGNALDASEVLKAAYQLRVDAYSLNPNLQALLAHIARDKEMGRLFLSGVTFLIPGSSVLSLSNDVAGWDVRGMAPGGGSEEVEKLIASEGPAELLARINTFYRQHIGMENTQGSAVSSLLNNALYSPRQQAYIAYYLDDMKSAAGLPETVEYLAKEQSAFGAAYSTAQLQMIHAVHKEFSPLKAIVPMDGQIGLLNTAGQFIVIPLWDHTRERANVRNLLIQTMKMGKRLGAGSLQVWFTGDCDGNTISTAAAAGIAVRRNVILDSTFRFTALRRLSYKRKGSDPLLEDAGTVLPDHARMAERASTLVIPSNPAEKPAQPYDMVNPKPAAPAPAPTRGMGETIDSNPLFRDYSDTAPTGAPAPSPSPAENTGDFDNTPVFHGNTPPAPAPAPAPTPAPAPAPGAPAGDDLSIPGIDTTGGMGM